jgi:signal transduction histidine kinase
LYDLGFEPAVKWLAGQFSEQHGIACEFEDDGKPKPISEDAKIILFQSVRELLANVYKHARAQSVSVSTLRDGNVVRIAVEDDGVGFDPRVLSRKIKRNEGFGLFNLRERLSHLQGDLKIDSKIGEGTSVTLMAPLKRARKTAVKK